MPKFLHTADLHLNAQRRRFDNYLQRSEWILDKIAETAVAHECDCIVIAGDIYEHTNLTINERNLFSAWLGRISTPVLAITGNHDKRSDVIGDTCLAHLTSLRLHAHLIHADDPKVVNAFGITWVLFPYQNWTSQEFYLLVMVLVQKARKKWKEAPVVVVMHEDVQGCVADNGMVVTKANQIKITEEIAVDYWAMGHIHLCQQILPNAFYCGAPHQVYFNDREEKGILIVDTENLASPEFIRFESPFPLVKLTSAPLDGVWPIFAIYAPEDDTGVEVPPHVVYEPQSTTPILPIDSSLSSIDILDGLSNRLQQMGLSEKLIPRTERFARKMLESLTATSE